MIDDGYEMAAGDDHALEAKRLLRNCFDAGTNDTNAASCDVKLVADVILGRPRQGRSHGRNSCCLGNLLANACDSS